MEAVNGALAFAQGVRDLYRRQADDVAQYQHLALVLGQVFKRLPQRPTPIEGSLSSPGVGQPHLLGGDRTLRPEMVERRVAGYAEDPSVERNRPLFVLVDRGDQLGEDVLGDVFRLVGIADQAGYVTKDVVRIADVEIVQSLTISRLGTSHSQPSQIAGPVAQCGAVGRAAHCSSPSCSPHDTSLGCQIENFPKWECILKPCPERAG